MDDDAAIRSAKLLALVPVNTPFVLLEARRARRVDQEEYRLPLETLVAERHFLSAPMFQRLLEEREE